MKKSELVSGNKTFKTDAFENELEVFRRALFSGDCVRELTISSKKVFVLEEFITNVDQLIAFEKSVARVKKVV